MTREELKLSIELEIVSSVLQGRGAADNILALFDRYEAEQWSKPGEVPTGGPRRVLVCADRVVFDMYWIDTAAWGVSWRFRELPAPPQP